MLNTTGWAPPPNGTLKDSETECCILARLTIGGTGYNRIHRACPALFSWGMMRRQQPASWMATSDPAFRETCPHWKRKGSMKITWYGHACFAIESSDGIRVFTDPYDPETSGFKPYRHSADLIIKSSSDDDFHDNDHLVPKRAGATVIDALELAENSGATTSHRIPVRAIDCLEHLDHRDGNPERNAMYRFVVDGISIGHMGDMGNDFSDEHLDFFADVDILLSLAGGFPVISMEVLAKVVASVRPRLVIPMHFRTLCFKPANMHFVTEFLKLFDASDVDFAARPSVELDRDELPEPTRALVLSYV